MPTCKTVTDKITEEILSKVSEKFTGKLELEVAAGENWDIYFLDGLMYSGNGIHPIRSWYRQIYRYCPQLVGDTTNWYSHPPQDGNDNFLTELVKQKKISSEQMVRIIEGNILEILFDTLQNLAQQNSDSGWQTSYNWIPKTITNAPWIVLQTDQVWRQAMQLWQTWQAAGLTEISPNLSPRILAPEELRRQTSELIYCNLISLADRNWTLRDLAVKLNRNLLLLTQPMLPYIRQGLLELIEVKDLNFAIKPSGETNGRKSNKIDSEVFYTSASNSSSTSPLVVCIDDSRVDILAINHIITKAGYRCITIQEEQNAVSKLISHQPDLIFLDLVMPIANGFEICAQIRRIPLLKDIPVIILTGNDGVVDRARAKIVGASGFLTKPVKQDEVLKILHENMPNSQSHRQEGMKGNRRF